MRTKLIAVGLLVVGAVAASGRAQRQPATADDLLNEIRGLRADLRQTTRASAQMQLLTARLQLQEQRLAVLSNQRAGVTARLSVESRERADAEARVRTFEENETAQESDLSAQIASEQNRWQDFNNRLDELERSLK